MRRALRGRAVLFLIAGAVVLAVTGCGGGSTSTTAQPSGEGSSGVVADGGHSPGYIYESSIGNEPLEVAELTAYFRGQLESQTGAEWELHCSQYEKPQPSERLYICGGTGAQKSGLTAGAGAYLWGIDQSTGKLIPIEPIEVGSGYPYSGPVEVGPNGELTPKPE